MNEFEIENWCSLEASQLMKEIGFDEECLGFYSNSEPKKIWPYRFGGYSGEDFDTNKNSNYLPDEHVVCAPMFLSARKWLREKHGLDVVIEWFPAPPRDEDDTKEFLASVSWMDSEREWSNELSEHFQSEPEAWNAAIIKACETLKERK